MPGAIAARPDYAVSLRVRKRIEEVFGWSKTVGSMRRAKRQGRSKVGVQTGLGFATYNLGKRLPLAPLPASA